MTARAARELPEVERLREQFSYDAETGVLRWRAKRSGLTHGAVAGRKKPSGHLAVMLDRVSYLVHRIAWKIHYEVEPPPVLDHINGNPADNRICNLRAATVAENGRNKRALANSCLGVKGVVFDKQTQKFRAQIRVNGKLIALGRFRSLNEANAAYISASKQHFGEFAPNEGRK